MHDTFTRKEAHLLLQQALSVNFGLLVWTSEPIAFARILYNARREDPALQCIKVLRTPNGVAICHEPNKFDLNEEEQDDEP